MAYEFIPFYFELTSIKIALWDGEMSQWVKVLVVKLNRLSITPRVHTGEGETKFQRFSYDFHMGAMASKYSPIYTQRNKIKGDIRSHFITTFIFKTSII